jgi:hypothetical protein
MGITGKAPELRGRTISIEMLKRYNEFGNIGQSFAGDMRAAQRALAHDFGRSYFYYYVFGRSGISE